MARKNTEKYMNHIKETYGDKVEVLSEFQGKEYPITICYHCEKHGDTIKTMVAKNVFNKNFCPCKECQHEHKSKIRSFSKIDLYNRLVGYCASRGGTVIEKEWTKSKDIYHFKCDNSEHPVFESTADSLFSGKHWCPYCSGRIGDFEKEIDGIIHSKGGVRISKYVNSATPIRVKCVKHDFEWDIAPCNIKKGRWCPVCNMRLSEKAVWDWYKERNVKVVPQYTFDGFTGDLNNKYRFDFGILSENDELQYLLEIDDETHRGSCEKNAHVRQSDKLKDQYCKDHNINLIRIPISYSKLRVMPEEWYRSFIAEKLANI